MTKKTAKGLKEEVDCAQRTNLKTIVKSRGAGERYFIKIGKKYDFR